MTKARRDPRNDPRPGDILGHRWKSKWPRWRKFICCDARTQLVRYLDDEGHGGITSRAEWREWAARATAPDAEDLERLSAAPLKRNS